MKIKTVQIQGLTPSRLHPGKGWEPGWEVGGDQGNGLLDKVGRRLWAALLGATRLALGDNQSRLPASGWETIPPQVQSNKAAHHPSAVASQMLPPWSRQKIVIIRFIDCLY